MKALNNRKVVDESRETIARSLGTTPENIYFTAGGSESDNWALKCTAEAYANKGKHIITSKIEQGRGKANDCRPNFLQL